MLNSIKYQLFKEQLKQDNPGNEPTRQQIRFICKSNNYKTSLLDLYNKSYSYTFEALAEYIEVKLPKKYLKLIINNI